jgi:hypothetical protein
MNISDMLQTPEKYIPFGQYCYDKSVCPFWAMKVEEYPKQEDGFCYFLQKSDWDINEEHNKTAKIIYSNNGTLDGMFVTDLEDDNDIDPISGKKCHFPMSSIWDQCKECNINMEDPDDIVLVRTNLGEGEEHD